MSNDELKTRVEIMRSLGVQRLKDGDLEIVMFPDEPKPETDEEAAKRRAERRTFGGK